MKQKNENNSLSLEEQYWKLIHLCIDHVQFGYEKTGIPKLETLLLETLHKNHLNNPHKKAEQNRDALQSENQSSRGPYREPIPNLRVLREIIQSCSHCGDMRTPQEIFCGIGSLHPKVLIICETLETWGSDPFLSSQGIFMLKWLESIGLDGLKDTYFTPLIKCAWKEGKIKNQMGCSDSLYFLENQIRLLKPQVVLCIDESSYACLLKNKFVNQNSG